MPVELTPVPDTEELADLDLEARRLSEGLGHELTALAIDRITRFYQPIVETLRFSRVILEAVTDGALAFDPSGRVALANSTAQRLFGLPPDIAGRALSDVPELAAIQEPVKTALASGQSTVSHRITLQRNGEVWELDLALHFCRDARDGTAYWLLAIVRDLTQVKDLTFQLTQASKMASLGTMLSCIIHDVNNPLANILGYAELIAAEMDDSPQSGLEPFRNRVRIIVDETLRARRIVENCLSFARLSKGGHRPIKVAQLIEETVAIFRGHLKQKGARIEDQYPAELPVIYGNWGLLQQVVFNLIKNAIDVLDRTGVVRVSVRTDGNDLSIDVADNGPGIRPEHRSRIFHPFFTTKSEKEGTGLGLSIARTIVEDHGGHLTFESQLGTGTTFTVTLPIERRTARREGPKVSPAPVQDAARAVPQLLLVDDDPVMAKLIGDLVGRWYDVQTDIVYHVEAAESAIATGKYRMVFFNVRMGGVDGVAALERLAAVAPSTTSIVTVAGSERPEFVETLLRRGAAAHLKKPFSLNTLLKVLGRMLPPEAAKA
ncbi:MAG: response regulator [Candidatus Riflebacteria bacterium]|nr:response regulator [Candidatus Riflebacteria bacterium]